MNALKIRHMDAEQPQCGLGEEVVRGTERPKPRKKPATFWRRKAKLAQACILMLVWRTFAAMRLGAFGC